MGGSIGQLSCRPIIGAAGSAGARGKRACGVPGEGCAGLKPPSPSPTKTTSRRPGPVPPPLTPPLALFPPYRLVGPPLALRLPLTFCRANNRSKHQWRCVWEPVGVVVWGGQLGLRSEGVEGASPGAASCLQDRVFRRALRSCEQLEAPGEGTSTPSPLSPGPGSPPCFPHTCGWLLSAQALLE